MIAESRILDLSSIQSQLSPVQFEAVRSADGPQLILAGAGSGKTRVLTFKIAALLSVKDVYPSQILAVTFTNKAAAEMKRRVGALLGESIALTWLGTFHSVCAKILRMYGEVLGYSSAFTIYDRDDQKKFIKALLAREGEPEGGVSADQLRFGLSNFKNSHQTPAQVRQNADSREEERLGYLYMRYQEGLKANNAMDFDDLIFQTYLLLQNHPETRQRFQESFKYILIDEFQDTNKTQFELIRLLLGPHQNITVVGDEDQSIYGWRGADIQNILSFQRHFPGVGVIKLEENYRSTANILGVAASVIRNNQERLGKTIFTQNPAGEKVRLKEHDTDLEEARWTVLDIQEDTTYPPGETAIFYRTNAQSRVFEDRLRSFNIPYVIVGGTRFYDRKEVKDILAYLQALQNPKDSVSLGRIINVPKRGIGDRTVESFADLAIAENITLMEALQRAGEYGVKSATLKKIAPFVGLMESLAGRKNQLALPDLVNEVIESSGYKKALEEEGSSEAFDRLANAEELISAAEEFLERNPEGDLEGFLAEISLLTDADEKKDTRSAVTLMTVHASKGLEFAKVYVTGLEEGIFPLTRGQEENLEEERRLFYVAVTRARKKLSLSTCQMRRLWGRESVSAKSRFLGEIDPTFLQVDSRSPQLHYSPPRASFDSDDQDTSAHFEEENQQTYYIGQSVYHGKYGEGTILKIEGSGEEARVTVKFSDIPRKLVAKYAKLSFFDD